MFESTNPTFISDGLSTYPANAPPAPPDELGIPHQRHVPRRDSPAEQVALVAAQDQIVLDRTRAGDTEAFGELFSHYHEALLAFATRRIGPTDAEDMVLEAFARAFQTIQRGSEVIDFSRRGAIPWLTRITHNTIIDAVRKKQRTQEELTADIGSSDIDSSGSAPSAEDETMKAVEVLGRQALLKTVPEIISKLTPDQQAVIQYRFYEGRTPAQTAELLNRTLNATKVLQNRALRSLRRCAREFIDLDEPLSDIA